MYHFRKIQKKARCEHSTGPEASSATSFQALYRANKAFGVRRGAHQICGFIQRFVIHQRHQYARRAVLVNEMVRD